MDSHGKSGIPWPVSFCHRGALGCTYSAPSGSFSLPLTYVYDGVTGHCEAQCLLSARDQEEDERGTPSAQTPHTP
jgi:hypothetical protein